MKGSRSLARARSIAVSIRASQAREATAGEVWSVESKQGFQHRTSWALPVHVPEESSDGTAMRFAAGWSRTGTLAEATRAIRVAIVVEVVVVAAVVSLDRTPAPMIAVTQTQATAATSRVVDRLDRVDTETSPPQSHDERRSPGTALGARRCVEVQGAPGLPLRP
jgi:hypothetical protein